MKTVLISGTSSGIGRATAVELAKRGWSVVATMRDLTKRAALDEALQHANATGRVRVAPLDVSDADSIESLVTSLDLANKPLDAVVNNAGIGAGGAFEDLSDELVRKIMEVNFFGVLALTRRLMPVFRAQRRGRIVIVSSETAFAGQPSISPYCASKWALEGWAESLCYEVEPFDIKVILIEPGAIHTNIWTSSPRIIPAASPYRPLLQQLNAAVNAHVEQTARPPEDVARVIALALEAGHPRFRYTVGTTAWIGHLMRGKVPSSVLRWIVRRYFGLNQVRV